MPLPDNTLPPNPRHDATAAFNAQRPLFTPSPVSRSPAPTRRLAVIFSVICVAATPVILAANDLLFLVAVAIGLFTAASAFVLSIAAWRRNARTPRTAESRISVPQCVRLLVIGAALLTFNSWSCLQCTANTRDISKSVVSTANLRGFATAMEIYRANHGVAPTSLQDLVRVDLASPKQLYSPFDHVAWTSSGTPTPEPSYVFIPSAATGLVPPNTLLAYERHPYCKRGLSLFPERVHAIVRADCSATWLTPDELAAELAKHPAPPTTQPP